MPDWLAPWITPSVVIARLVWLRIDIRDLHTDVRDVRDRLARLEGRIDGWQDQQRPPVA